jgi:hypothetical protein
MCNGQGTAELLFLTTTVTGLTPDDKGRVSGSGSFEVNHGIPSDQLCSGLHFSIQYSAMTLTNLTSGHVYGLDDVIRTYP